MAVFDDGIAETELGRGTVVPADVVVVGSGPAGAIGGAVPVRN